MAGRLINIGFGNLVSAEKITAVVSPDGAPVRRLVQNAKERQRCVDATQGRRTKSVLVMDTDYIVLSALVPDTIARRYLAPAPVSGGEEVSPEELLQPGSGETGHQSF